MASCLITLYLVPSHSHYSTCCWKQSGCYHHSNSYQLLAKSHLRSSQIRTTKSRKYYCSQHIFGNIHLSLGQSSLLLNAIQQYRSLQYCFFSNNHLHLNLHCSKNSCKIIFSKWIRKYLNWLELNSLYEIFHCFSYTFSLIHTF